ncbi:hypothetical protein TNCV_2837701 [Trichonephila clavipes]|nr:hypothetical protein TNCV_2837701 [Trichonephila clavipes]
MMSMVNETPDHSVENLIVQMYGRTCQEFSRTVAKASAETWLNGQGPDFYQDGLNKLILRSDKCLNRLDDRVSQEIAPHTVTPCEIAVCRSTINAGLDRWPVRLQTRVRWSSSLRLNRDSFTSPVCHTQVARGLCKLPVRLINTTNERRLVQGPETPMRVKGDIDDFSSELDNGVKGCHSWMKCPEFYCSRRVRHLIKPAEDL